MALNFVKLSYISLATITFASTAKKGLTAIPLPSQT